jgi:hypothetical protein
VRRTRGAVLVAIAAVSLASPRFAHGADSRAQEDDRRSIWIENRLADEQPRARLWTWTWVAVNGVGMIGQLAVGAAVATDQRASWNVGGATCAAGLIPLLFLPLSSISAASRLRDSGLTGGARRRYAEKLLKEGAEDEAFGRSVWMHLAGVAVGVGSTTVLGLGYAEKWWPEPPSASTMVPLNLAVTLVGTVAVSELQIWTQPTGLVRAERDYEHDAWVTGKSYDAGLHVSVIPWPGGLMLTGAF